MAFNLRVCLVSYRIKLNKNNLKSCLFKLKTAKGVNSILDEENIIFYPRIDRAKKTHICSCWYTTGHWPQLTPNLTGNT